MVFRQFFLVNNDCYKAGITMEPQGIMVHSTGANNPNLRRYVDTKDGYTGANLYGNDWNRSGVGACVHGFIGLDAAGDVGFIQTLPWRVRSWHCGRSGNNTHLSFEICEDNLESRDYFERTRDKAIEVCAFLCRELCFDPLKPGVILDHAEGSEAGIASNHSDVRHWWNKFGYTMAQFRKDVKAAMDKEQENNLELRVEELEDTVDRLMDMVDGLVSIVEKRFAVYKTLLDVPSWAQPEIKRLCESGLLEGDGSGNLNIPKDALQPYLLMCRVWEAVKGVG